MSYDPLQVDIPRLLALLGFGDAQHYGDVWKAKCPSGEHADHKPSWSIKDVPGDRKHGAHYCFSCKYSGTAAELAASVLGIQVRSAVDWIIERAMGSLPDVHTLRVVVGPLARHRLALPPGVVIAPPAEWPESAIEYAGKRGISEAQITNWGIGYAVDGPLKGRLFIPARSPQGILLNWTARTFVDHPKRYLACPAKDGPDEGAIFGEMVWPWQDSHTGGRRGTVVVTEGALNALAVERAFRDVFFGSLFGSNVQLAHVMKLATFEQAIILTDPDLAGDRAAEFLEAALCRHMKIGRARLRSGTDAASISREELAQVIAVAEVR